MKFKRINNNNDRILNRHKKKIKIKKYLDRFDRHNKITNKINNKITEKKLSPDAPII